MKKNIWLLLIGIILILCGIYVLLNPQSALIASAITIGLLLIFLGSGYILSFKNTQLYPSLALGLLDIFVGILFLTNIGITASTMPIIFAFWVLFNAIAQIIMGLEVKDISQTQFKALLLAGILGMIFALLIFIYPVIGRVSITLLLGAYLIGYGVLELHRYFKSL